MRKSLYVLTLSLTIVMAGAMSAGAYNWEKTNFDASTLNSEMGRIQAHPTDPNTIYVPTLNMPDILSGDIDPADGLWRSTDLGDTWVTLNDGVLLTEYNVMDLAICKADPNVMYAATIREGIFKTTDGGESWMDMSGGFSYGGETFPNGKWAVLATAVDPTNPDKVYLSVGNTGELDIFNLSPEHPGFYYSHDGGVTWTANNNGLPPREDSILDGSSRTAAAASIIVLPQMPSYIILGMADLHANISLLFGRNAVTEGMAFYNTNSGVGNFREASTGLPTNVKQTPELFGSLARVSSSIMMLSTYTGSSIGLWASHISFTVDMNLATTTMYTRNKGLFFTPNGVWTAKNSGLPEISSWTDNCSEPDMTIKYKDTYNAGPVGVGQGPVPHYAMVGSLRSDQGGDNNNTKIYASTNSGSTWLKAWDTGLLESPTMGYTEANSSFVVFNANNSYLMAAIYWSDVTECDLNHVDDGIYRMSTAP